MHLNLGIRLRVMLVATLPAIVLAVISTIIFTGSRLADLEQAHSDRGRALARQLAGASEYPVFAGDREALRRLANAALTESDVRGILITDAAGTILAHGGDILPIRPQSVTEAVFVQDDLLRVIEPIYPSQPGIDDPLSPSRSEQGRAPLGSVVVELGQANFLERRNRTIWAGFGTLIIVLLGSLVLAERMSRSVTDPIRSVAGTVTKIGEGQLSERAQIDASGSLKALADGVNNMAARLESAHEEMTRKVADATAALLAGKEEAERANLAKSRFLAAASHDLRQPMHALGLFIAELQEQTHAPPTRRLVRQIAASAEAMENLLDSLLDISRLDAGVLQPNLQAFALQPMLDRIASGYRPMAEERGLVLKLHPTRRWAHTDPVLLERILVNLVSNAIRYTPKGAILLGVREAVGSVRIEVRDSGIGIAPEAQNIIFQEFVQLANPERARNKGLGLGLAIVRRLTDLLKLPLTLRSTPGAGSTFSITVPTAQPERTLLALDSDRAAGDLGGLLVAVVDDDPLALSGLQSLLQSWQCEVVAATDQASLLADLEEQGREPDLLISDYRLEGGHNGADLVYALRQRFGPSLPAVLISGDTGSATLRHAQEAGLVILHKPVRPARLRALIYRLLSN